MVPGPLIPTGCEGKAETDTLKLLSSPAPQALFAVTDTFPLAAPAVALMLVEVELPVHPKGRVQVYDVAPGTAVML